MAKTHKIKCLYIKMLEMIGCPLTILSSIKSFHEDMRGTVIYDVSTFNTFDIRSGVKQGHILAPTLFGTFFAVMLQQAIGKKEKASF